MHSQATHHLTPAQGDRPVSWKRALAFVLILTLLSLVLFVVAGTFVWWQGWVYVGVMVGINLLSRYLIYRRNPGLVAERFQFTSSAGIKGWDKWLAPLLSIVCPLLVFVVAGLDKRNGWSPEWSPVLEIAAVVPVVAGGMFGVWAMLENPFFSSVVRIQTDRGQQVITTGPYRFVRHPAYSGNLLWWAFTPVMLGSLWAFIPALFTMAVLVTRTVFEDRTLLAELPGYPEYARRVRFRLIPAVW